MVLPLVAALILTSVDPFVCETSCGLTAPEATPTQCKALQRFQDRTLQEFEFYVVGWTRARTCQALKGWTLIVWPEASPDGSWQDPDDGWILGQTLPAEKLIFVGLSYWGDSALAHELAHVISWALEHDLTHVGWTERNICRAVNMASDHFHCEYSKPGIGRLLR